MDTICLEIRRELTAEPNSRNSEMLQHLSTCKKCSEYLRILKPFDEKLKSAINIEVPDGLESRIILAQRMAQTEEDIEDENVISINQSVKKDKISGKRDFRWMSLAAALVLAVGLSFGMFKLGESHGVQNEVLAHIDSHLFELEVDDNIKLASLNNLLQEHGLSANENIGYIRHVSNCPIDGKMVPHLVVSDDQGKAVTVMYIPWEDSSKRTPFKNDRFNGVLVGAQKGSFVIVSEDPNSLQPMEDRVMNAVEVNI